MIAFRSNKISYISNESLFNNIRWLILTNNLISIIPASIEKCIHLQKLLLAGNKIKELPLELSFCRSLELIRISVNELTEVLH